MKRRRLIMCSLTGISALILRSCATIPGGAVAVKPFDRDRYLGKWYEIARMDFRFERNLSNVTANYSLNDNGTIKVDNRGYNTVTKEWKQAIGKAKFAGDQDIAMLKVSFFGPFFAPYNVIALDDHYRYALVAGKNIKYLWLLSREMTMPDDVKKRYLELARDLGFDVDALVWTGHEKR